MSVVLDLAASVSQSDAPPSPRESTKVIKHKLQSDSKRRRIAKSLKQGGGGGSGSGRAISLVVVPASETQHVEVTIVHRHEFGGEVDDEKTRKQSRKIIDEARRIEAQRSGAVLPEVPATTATIAETTTTTTAAAAAAAAITTAATTITTALAQAPLSGVLDALKNATASDVRAVLASHPPPAPPAPPPAQEQRAQFPASSPSLPQPQQPPPHRSVYGNFDAADGNSLFAEFHDDMFDFLNAGGNLLEEAFPAPPPPVNVLGGQPRASTATAAAGDVLPFAVLEKNTAKLSAPEVEPLRDFVDVEQIRRASFGNIAELHSPLDFGEARTFVSHDGSALFERTGNFDRSREVEQRQRSSMDETAGVWARAYARLARAGNPGRVDADHDAARLVGEKTEQFVRASEHRKFFYRPYTLVDGAVMCGNHGLLTMLENPALFLLPTSALWTSRAMYEVYGTPVGGAYGELVDFERARVGVLNGGALVCDTGWHLWYSCAEKAARCVRGVYRHAELQPTDDERHTPNVDFYEPSDDAEEARRCRCAHNGTVVLCCKSTHQHCVEPLQRPRAGQRSGSTNASIVAAGVLGAATRERWLTLMAVCAELPHGRHATLLVDTFLAALEAHPQLRALVPCIREFSVCEEWLLHVGKAHDARVLPASAPMATHGERCLPADGHGRERFRLYDPLALTLALLLFHESTLSVGWLNVWRVWNDALECHANCCPFCSKALSDSLHRIVVYNALLPVLSLTAASMLERLAPKIRCNRDVYRF